MSTREKWAEELKEFLIEDLLLDLSMEEISEEASLGNEIGVDSLGFTELMAHIEDEYKIKVSDEDFTPENFRTLNKVMDLIESKINN